MANFMQNIMAAYQMYIQDVMEEYEIEPDDVPRRFKRQSAHGNCRSACGNCKQSWGSHLGWLTFDFKAQRIHKFWRQKCKTCQRPKIMTFSDAELIRMIEIALIRLIQFMNGVHPAQLQDRERPSDEDDPDADTDPPHEMKLCEKCLWGARRCWRNLRRR